MPKVKAEVKPEKKESVVELLKRDYYLEFQSREIFSGKNLVRTVLVLYEKWLIDGVEKEDRKIVNIVDKEAVEFGYGTERSLSIDDFIRRNNSSVLDKIFEIKL